MYPRGRPAKVFREDIINAILQYKNRIIVGEKIISKCDKVWCEIARALQNLITPLSIYTLVSCNRYGIRDKINGCSEEKNVATDLSIESNVTESFQNRSSIELKNTVPITFAITVPTEEFEELIVWKSYKRMHRKNLRHRMWKTLKPGIWQEFITKKIWDAIHLKCGFRFRNHYISNNVNISGYINGSCKCGSTLRCDIESIPEETILKCTIFEGTGKCGKRYLREPSRKLIAQKLCNKPVDVYRSEEANQLMEPGDPEPPYLYKASVLHVAKEQYLRSQFRDKDPLTALRIMKHSSHLNSIHNIDVEPFFCHYWTNHQLQIYRKYCSTNISSLYIDATGSVVKKLMKTDKTLSKHIFLYQGVINYNGNQFSVTQMLSERHTTNFIHLWLLEWTIMGAPYPREVVVDFSKALLNAVIRAFTFYPTIQKYANACKNKDMPEYYVRIDCPFYKNVRTVFKNSSTTNKNLLFSFYWAISYVPKYTRSCHNISSNIDNRSFRNRGNIKKWPRNTL